MTGVTSVRAQPKLLTMDNFTEDTNPFHTDPDEVSNITVESNVDFASRPDSTDEQEQPSAQPPELPSKRAYPNPRPHNQSGFKTALDLYLHSGEDVEIHVCTLSLYLNVASHPHWLYPLHA